MKDMKIATPVFHGINRDPARFCSEEEGWIDPREVCGITSGQDIIPKVHDVRGNPKGTRTSGQIFSVLRFKGGSNTLLVVGAPAQVRQNIQLALGGVVEQSEPEEKAE